MRKTLHWYSDSQLRPLFKGLDAFPWRGVDFEGYSDHRVLVCLGEADDGRIICTGVLIDPKKTLEIPSRLLRDIRLGEVVTFAAVANRFLPVGTVKRQGRPVHRARPGPTGYPESFYKRVAEAYALALKTYPRTPVRRLMTVLSCSEATAHRHLKRCENLGLVKPRRSRRTP